LGRDLLFKLRAQITFDSDGTAALKLRGPEAKTLIFTVAQEKEWWLYAPEGRPLEISEPPVKIPGMWPKVNPRSGLKCTPSSGGTATLSAKNSTSVLARPRSEFKDTLSDFKIWDLLTLSDLLEHPLTTSPEIRD
jgi:hypothetical protein